MARPSQSIGFYYVHYVWFIVNLFQFSIVQLPPLPSLAYQTKYSTRIFLPKILSLLSSFFVIVQVSTVYVSIGPASVLYVRIFVFLENNCYLS